MNLFTERKLFLMKVTECLICGSEHIEVGEGNYFCFVCNHRYNTNKVFTEYALVEALGSIATTGITKKLNVIILLALGILQLYKSESDTIVAFVDEIFVPYLEHMTKEDF